MKLQIPSDLQTASRPRAERWRAVALRPGYYGLDQVDVLELKEAGWVLHLHFIPNVSGVGGEGTPPGLDARHLQVWDEDGRYIHATVSALEPLDPLTVEVTFLLERGSLAELQHRSLTLGLTDLDSVDPVFSYAHFRLSLEREQAPSAPEALAHDALALSPSSYQAKDYESFTRLMLDRLRLTVPAWKERHAADLGVMLVELLAHAGDTLSYYQDAVSAEAYLGTAQRRTSLRRHARLLDYSVHEGCNARVWMHVAPQRELELPAGTAFHTVPHEAVGGAWDVRPPEHHSIFESLAPVRLRPEHTRFQPYTWGARTLTLPRGATSVTLLGHHATLRAGDVLILEELRHPDTGREADADPNHRHAVRLNETPELDKDPLDDTPLTRVSWFPEDALPFTLHMGNTRDEQPLAQVLGNVVLADHGQTQPPVEVTVEDDGTLHLPLGNQRVVNSERYSERRFRTWPASETLEQQPRQTLPWVQVFELRPGREVAWEPQHDLLSSDRLERHFVADVNDGDELVLRFGDGAFGRRMRPGSRLRVTWRSGHAPHSAVGADRLVRMDARFAPFVDEVRNPLSARGGLASEDAERVRRDAPNAFREQHRCVIDEDYVTLARRVPGVRAAAVQILWNGSWHVARVHVLPQEGRAPTARLLERIQHYLSEHRIIGIEVEVRPPEFVPLDIALRVGLKAGYAFGTVHAALERELGSGTLEDGRLAFFHPSAFGFGQSVYLAPLIARAASVPGVAWVEALRFQRWGQDESSELESGRILASPTEVLQVEGRPGRPDLGLIHIHVTGGGR